jgi:predicted nucleic acid-binding protein
MRDKAVFVEITILVDYLRGSDAAAEYLDKARAEGDLLCSTVTQAELIVGSRTRGEIREIDQLLARFQNEPIASGDSTRALTWLRKYYHSRGMGFHDCLLGAVAVRRKIPIATLNEKHFQGLPGVKVVRPYWALGGPE